MSKNYVSKSYKIFHIPKNMLVDEELQDKILAFLKEEVREFGIVYN